MQIEYTFVGFEVFTTVTMKNAVFWGVAPCRCGRWTDVSEDHIASSASATCSRWFFPRGFFYPEDGGDTILRNVGSIDHIYTAPHPRRRHSSEYTFHHKTNPWHYDGSNWIKIKVEVSSDISEHVISIQICKLQSSNGREINQSGKNIWKKVTYTLWKILWENNSAIIT
jgi:hypothetical protein